MHTHMHVHMWMRVSNCEGGKSPPGPVMPCCDYLCHVIKAPKDEGIQVSVSVLLHFSVANKKCKKWLFVRSVDNLLCNSLTCDGKI